MAKILIIEDSPTQMETFKRVIEGMGHTTLCAENGDIGAEMALSNLPQMILMDVLMPGPNGFQTTRKISKTPETSQIPIVIISTKGDAADKMWGMKQGAKAYITKPISDNELKRVITETLK